MTAAVAARAGPGIQLAASLGWLWLVERQPPTVTDLLGTALALVGALVIVGFAPKQE
jgi:small multidrug resistance family-3 protein